MRQYSTTFYTKFVRVDSNSYRFTYSALSPRGEGGLHRSAGGAGGVAVGLAGARGVVGGDRAAGQHTQALAYRSCIRVE